MVCEKYFSKFFESIKPRKKNKQLNPKSDCLPTEIHHHTTTQIHKVDFSWTIDELDFHITKKEFLKSCKFSSITNDECKWRLFCLPYDKLYKPGSDVLVGICVCLVFIPDHADTKLLVKSEICFLNCTQKELKNRTAATTSTTRPIDKYGCKNIRIMCMPVGLKKKHILPGNKLTIRLNLTYTNIDDSTIISIQDNTSKSERLEQFAILYRKDKCKNVLISVKGKNYLVHKATLAAYSPTFAAFFERTPEKGNITQIKIPDVNKEVFGEMLKYIETGTLSDENKTVDLFILATEFNLGELQSKVIWFMHDKYQWRT
ncbi:speckle-type POZ protein-like [Planococcus citri]|uniref:speckle-type POZ protein-like n=1 Tax=Planococcus citri TaxID=170843 RepID=UPI0031F8CE8D